MKGGVKLQPNINQIIEISVNEEDSSTLKSRVADIGETTFAIEMPIDKNTGRVKVLFPGDTIKAWYSTDLGQFSFETNVVDKTKKDIVTLAILNKPTKFERLQRRDFLRVSASLEASFRVLGNNDDKWHRVKTIDLSGGGMQIILSHDEIYSGQEIIGWLVLPFKNGIIDHVQFKGQIVRVIEANNSFLKHLISVKFTNIEEHVREKIIRYCYEKQVENKKKTGQIG